MYFAYYSVPGRKKDGQAPPHPVRLAGYLRRRVRAGLAPALASRSVPTGYHIGLINEYVRIHLHEIVQPPCISLRHIDAAMRAVNGVLRAAGVEMREVRARAIFGAPPAIVQKVAVARSEEHTSELQ